MNWISATPFRFCINFLQSNILFSVDNYIFRLEFIRWWSSADSPLHQFCSRCTASFVIFSNMRSFSCQRRCYKATLQCFSWASYLSSSTGVIWLKRRCVPSCDILSSGRQYLKFFFILGKTHCLDCTRYYELLWRPGNYFNGINFPIWSHIRKRILIVSFSIFSWLTYHSKSNSVIQLFHVHSSCSIGICYLVWAICFPKQCTYNYKMILSAYFRWAARWPHS